MTASGARSASIKINRPALVARPQAIPLSLKRPVIAFQCGGRGNRDDMLVRGEGPPVMNDATCWTTKPSERVESDEHVLSVGRPGTGCSATSFHLVVLLWSIS